MKIVYVLKVLFFFGFVVRFVSVYKDTSRSAYRVDAFLCIEKAPKIDNQLLVGFIQRKGGGDYYADQSLLRLTPFPSLAAGLLAQSSRGIRTGAEVERLPK